MHRKLCNTLLILVATLSPLRQAKSQDSTETNGWLSALSIGFPSLGDMSMLFFTLGGNFTKIRPGRLGPDFAVGTIPVLLTQEVVPFGARGGLAMTMQPTQDLFVVPSAGISTFGVWSPGGHSSIWGRNVGIALVSRTGVRAGLTFHEFHGERLALLEIGAGRIR